MSSYRDRNNASSKKCYEKTIEQRYAPDYEHEVIRQHSQLPVTEAWHWSRAPEEILYESGYINSFSKERHERLMRKRELKEGVNRVTDYGFDGIARTKTSTGNVYSGIQAKYYCNRKVTGEKIGSFAIMQMKLICKNSQSKGYLYTSTRLEPNVADTLADPEFPIRHILHPWKPPDARTMPKYEIPPVQECDLPLRPYQEDALVQLKDKDGINGLYIPCGMGKTVISGHHLKGFNSSLIVAIAPLRVSVKNLQDRLSCFLPTYKSLLVDSDTDGTTNPGEIKRFLEEGDSNKIIYSTYDSAVEILSEIITCYEDAFCLADEIHNANEHVCKFINRFPNGLIMSATMPVEILEEIEVNHIVSIPFSYGIKEGYLVDYTVWLPHLVKASDGTTSVDVDIPVEFLEFNKELTAKALYLVACMLKTGSRRCIAYMSSQDECDAFMEIVSSVFQNYHGLNVWTNKIDSETPSKKRSAILEEFQNGNSGTYHILTSIRILDEAVDIPACDSEFVTSIGERSSDIRMMQRSMRGSRLDSKNPSKRNNIFLWADGWEKCVGALELLREADPEFHKKIRIADCNYDRSDSSERVEMIKAEVLEFEKWEGVQCLTIMEKHLLIISQISEFYGKYGETPNKRGKRNNEKTLGLWITCRRKNKKKGKLNSVLETLILKTFPWWSWDPIGDYNKKIMNEISDFYDKYKEEPKYEGKREKESILTRWIINRRMNKKRGILDFELETSILKRFSWWSWDPIRDYHKKIMNDISEFYKKYKEAPTAKGSRDNEKILGTWIGNRRKDKKKGKLNSELETQIIKAFPWWSWDPFSDSYKKIMKEISEFYKKYNEEPMQKENPRQNEKKLASWIRRRRDDKKKGMLESYLESQILTIFPWWSWDPISDSHKKIMNDISDFYKKYNEEPKGNGKRDNERKFASWIGSRRQNKKEGTLNVDLESHIISTFSWWSWDKFGDSHKKIMNEISDFYKKYNDAPNQRGKRENERKLGIWIQGRRKYKKDGNLDAELEALIKKELPWLSLE